MKRSKRDARGIKYILEGPALDSEKLVGVVGRFDASARFLIITIYEIKDGFIILEGIVIGVCDECGTRYYSAEILHAVHDIATGAKPFERVEEIPVSHLPVSQ